MRFAHLVVEIADKYEEARKEPLSGHSLAAAIRARWPASVQDLLANELGSELYAKASAGQGRWADSPWLAIFHSRITHGAKSGFYPVYLFEPGFETVCLVMGQGTETLSTALGRRALPELARRAELLRRFGGDWRGAGFTDGPFRTLKSVVRPERGDSDADPWSLSAAFGKRYVVAALPDDKELAEDLRAMLKLYETMVHQEQLRFDIWDESVEALKNAGELPIGSLDGVKRTVEHARLERRSRNRKLVKAVRELLGSSCQACGYSLQALYGASMGDYIEVHHKVPLHLLPEEGALLKPTEKDFVVLCSNCHKAIHRAGCPELELFRQQLKRVEGWPAA